MKPFSKQQGGEVLEFTIVALLFFMVLFGVIEFARLLFTWNTLEEATRRGARVAAVCPMNHAAVKQVTLSGNPDGNGPTLPALTTANVDVAYLDQAGTTTADPAKVRFVRVRIQNYQHVLLIPVVAQWIPAPAFTTTLPVESLGMVPVAPGETAIAAQCFGY